MISLADNLYTLNDANRLLTDEFPEMKRLYDEESDYYSDLEYLFYEDVFVPYVVKSLGENNDNELKKIFGFVENLLKNGDGELINMVGVAVVESLCNDDDFGSHKDTIFNIAGTLTIDSFTESLEYNPEDGCVK